MILVVIDPGVFISAVIGGRGSAPDLAVRVDAGLADPAVWTPRELADRLLDG